MKPKRTTLADVFLFVLIAVVLWVGLTRGCEARGAEESALHVMAVTNKATIWRDGKWVEVTGFPTEFDTLVVSNKLEVWQDGKLVEVTNFPAKHFDTNAGTVYFVDGRVMTNFYVVGTLSTSEKVVTNTTEPQVWDVTVEDRLNRLREELAESERRLEADYRRLRLLVVVVVVVLCIAMWRRR